MAGFISQTTAQGLSPSGSQPTPLDLRNCNTIHYKAHIVVRNLGETRSYINEVLLLNSSDLSPVDLRIRQRYVDPDLLTVTRLGSEKMTSRWKTVHS